MNSIEVANGYIEKAKREVNGKYRLKYHMAPPVGWMNDPNGLIYFDGEYRLYYQAYPFGSTNGVMHWGGFVSNDLVNYGDLGVVIAPDCNGENIFSGGAVEKDGKIFALYTRHYEHYGEKSEEIYLATSCNGKDFDLCGKVFDNETLPENISRVDFRDPCPAKIGDKYFVFVGGKDINTNRGLIVVLGGELTNLQYKFTIGPFYELGDMGECPSYCRVDGKDVIVASGCNVAQRGNDFKNVNSSVFIVGDIDFKNGNMNVDFIREIDKGDTFYAPQFISGAKTPTMIGWFEMWGKRYPTHEWGHGWAGAFTVPRQLGIEDGTIIQTPVKSLEKYERNAADGAIPKCADIRLNFSGEGKVTLKAENGEVVVGSDGGIYLDTERANNLSGCVRRTDGTYARSVVRILLDVSGIEIFISGGRETISGRIYLDGDYSLETDGAVEVESIKEIG